MSTYNFDVTTLTPANQAIIATILAKNGKVMDDHNCHAAEPKGLEGFSILRKDDEEYVVAVIARDYFSVNPLYLDEETGEVHLATGSVAGVVVVQDHASLEDAMEAFNVTYRESPFKWMRNTQLVIEATKLFTE